ncbi:beta-lactamase/transpeptidase-like protein [Auricularia subglabra TFB-10046 SS5]|uniref:Beta-lactamase/transpeptidase-like protein n=1 Tax=Auricularia subglabra (strain TFB-10046 / SS5) TaxID=717982 RepID=J0WTY3_AURST|nr:beta-lactamase/transpeptidase-like protein [Auricularia subglabra TFB-10046 SS5]
MPLAADIKFILEKACASPNGPAGLVYGAVDATGAMMVCETAGHLALGGDEPVLGVDADQTVLADTTQMKADACFALCSLTKLLTTIAAMQLVDHGKLTLDDPIYNILPEILEVGQLMPDGSLVTPAPRAHTEKITLRMLLSHTAGFGYTVFRSQLAAYSKASGGPDEVSGLREGTLGLPLVHAPGTRWEYGIGIDWAGEAVARVSGLGLGEYLKQNVFAPLGIEDAITFHLSPAQAARLAAFHQRGDDGTLRIVDHPPFVRDARFEAGGAGALGTLRAYLTVLTVLLNGGVGANGIRILAGDTVDSMSPGPDLSGISVGWREDWLGSVIRTESRKYPTDEHPTGRSANSGSWAGLANLYYSVDPTKGVAALIMSHSLPFFDPAVTSPFLEAEKALYASLK